MFVLKQCIAILIVLKKFKFQPNFPICVVYCKGHRSSNFFFDTCVAVDVETDAVEAGEARDVLGE